MKNKQFESGTNESQKEFHDLRYKSINSLRNSMNIETSEPRVNEFNKDIKDVRWKWIRSLSDSMKIK